MLGPALLFRMGTKSLQDSPFPVLEASLGRTLSDSLSLVSVVLCVHLSWLAFLNFSVTPEGIIAEGASFRKLSVRRGGRASAAGLSSRLCTPLLDLGVETVGVSENQEAPAGIVEDRSDSFLVLLTGCHEV